MILVASNDGKLSAKFLSGTLRIIENVVLLLSCFSISCSSNY